MYYSGRLTTGRPRGGKMAKICKRQKENLATFDAAKLHDLSEAIDVLKGFKPAKFDETVEIHLRLGVDGRHADQQVRGAIVLPHGVGKSKSVLVIAKDAKQQEAKDAGADYVGGEELIEKIKAEEWFDYDVIVATPDMMGSLGKLGRVLGPKGLMPNPKSGTVTFDLAKAVNEIKAGKVEYRLDKANIVHCIVGKLSFDKDKLVENVEALVQAVIKAKPAAAKGTYLRSVTLASTMSPGVRVNAAKF